MVWTPEQTGTFLDFVAHHRLYAYFHLLAHSALRRGEGLGQHWTDLDDDTGALAIRFQLLQSGWETEFDIPKTDSNVAIITLDREAVSNSVPTALVNSGSVKRPETHGSTSV